MNDPHIIGKNVELQREPDNTYSFLIPKEQGCTVVLGQTLGLELEDGRQQPAIVVAVMGIQEGWRIYLGMTG